MATKLPTLKELYQTKVTPALKQEFGYKNVMAVPKLVKVTLNVGFGQAAKDPKLQEAAVKTLTRITGQKPVVTVARKSISNFKIRQGMPVGAMVTLRGTRMYDFLTKLTRVALPRVRDFRGLPKGSVDAQGNLSIGFREHMVFPEIRQDELEAMHGLEVSIVSTAGAKAPGKRLFELLGFPFSEV